MKNKLKFSICSLCLFGTFILLSNLYAFGQENNQTVTDIDGNIYNTVIIGFQTWLKEDLKVTKYNNGQIIQNITDITGWQNHNPGGAYCWYNNDVGNKSTYGALYNWYAVYTGNLCPKGWHVPTDAEWTILTTYLGKKVAGGKLKEGGTSYWTQPNEGADNSSGFTALPGGYRSIDGTFSSIGYSGFWWSSTEYGNGAWYRFMGYGNSTALRHLDYKTYGFSVRCLRDN